MLFLTTEKRYEQVDNDRFCYSFKLYLQYLLNTTVAFAMKTLTAVRLKWKRKMEMKGFDFRANKEHNKKRKGSGFQSIL